MDIICQGWLTKSPPERRLHGALALFRKPKWRKRYFVLNKPAGSLPDCYELDYFRDDHMHKRVGRVDLEQCEQVTASLESMYYQFLFSVRTKHKGRDRVYYLASNSEEEMTKWVECLCHVCGLKQEDDNTGDDVPTEEAPPPPPPVRSDSIHQGSSQPSSPRDIQTSILASTLINQQEQEGYIPLEQCITGTTKMQNGDVPLDTLALKSRSRDSLASLPDAPPPPPPKDNTPERESFLNEPGTYDAPPKRVVQNSRESQDLYNVPPARKVGRDSSWYAVPPTREFISPENNGSIRNSSSSGYRTSGDNYDIVPRKYSDGEMQQSLNIIDMRPRSNTFNNDTSRHRSEIQSETYDYPPSRKTRSERDLSEEREIDSSPPPPRPPKPTSPMSAEARQVPGRNFIDQMDSLYDVPPMSGERQSMEGDSDVYDIPESKQSLHLTNSLLLSPPPPACPIPAGLEAHKYVNAATGFVPDASDPSVKVHKYINAKAGIIINKTENVEVDRLSPLEQDTKGSHSDVSSVCSVELNQPIPAPRQQSNAVLGYAEMTHKHQYTPMQDNGAYSVPPPAQELYSVPPPGASAKGPASLNSSVPPPKEQTNKMHFNYSVPVSSRVVQNQDAYSVPPPSRPVKSVSVKMPTGAKKQDAGKVSDVDTYACNIVPTPRTRSFKKNSPAGTPPHRRPTNQKKVLLPQKVQHSASSSDSSSGSEDEEEKTSRIYDSPPKARSRLSATPPPPKRNAKKDEIQYLDLDLEGGSSDPDKSPNPSQAHSPPPVPTTPTEYNEIDFVRTAALTTTKRDVESSRRISDKTDM